MIVDSKSTRHEIARPLELAIAPYVLNSKVWRQAHVFWLGDGYTHSLPLAKQSRRAQSVSSRYSLGITGKVACRRFRNVVIPGEREYR